MNLQTSKPLLLALMLIASSLAGCLGNTDEGDDSLGTVMVSTYHVQQLALALGGSTGYQPNIQAGNGATFWVDIPHPQAG